jgi:hypothetical protein
MVVRIWNIRLFAKKSIILSKIYYINLITIGKVSMIDGYEFDSFMYGTNVITYQENTQRNCVNIWDNVIFERVNLGLGVVFYR